MVNYCRDMLGGLTFTRQNLIFIRSFYGPNVFFIVSGLKRKLNFNVIRFARKSDKILAKNITGYYGNHDSEFLATPVYLKLESHSIISHQVIDYRLKFNFWPI